MKLITTKSGNEIIIDPNDETGVVTITILRTYTPEVELTIDECAQLGSALGAIVAKTRRRRVTASSIAFGDLEVGQKFTFVHHDEGICKKASNRHYTPASGGTWTTSANARVRPV